MDGFEAEFQALQVDEFFVFFGVAPQLGLAGGDDGTGHQGVDANAVLAQLAGQAARHAADGSFAAGVADQIGPPPHPADASHVDDRAGQLGAFELARHGLGGEHLVAQIQIQAVVPILGRELIERMAVVAARVVDQHLNGPQLCAHALQHGLQRRDVAHITSFVIRRLVVRCGYLSDQRIAAAHFGAAKRNVGALRRERLDDLRTNAGAAAGDENDFVVKRWVKGEHGVNLG